MLCLVLALAAAQARATEPSLEAPPPLRGDVSRGQKVYEQICATCHGMTGRGDGPVGKALTPRPADHTNTAYMSQLSDEHVYKVIKDGAASVGKSPMMAPWGSVLSDQDIRDVIGYVRTLSGT